MASADHTTCQHVPPLASSQLPDTRQLELAASMCHALSDASRLRLLLRLAEGERCVSEIVALEGAKLTSISSRLQMLHAARLVVRRRDAKHVYYALADQHIHELLGSILSHAAEPTA